MTAPELSVVIASVNGLPYVGHCLESLASFAPDAEVIVADSTDDETRAKLREAWPAVRCSRSTSRRRCPRSGPPGCSLRRRRPSR